MNGINDLKIAIENLTTAIKQLNTFDLQQIVLFGITCIFSLAAILISVFAFVHERKIVKQARFEKIMDDHRSRIMRDAIKSLWDEYNPVEEIYKGISDSEDFQSAKVKLWDRILADNELDQDRRYVTQFFHVIAWYFFDRKINRNDLIGFLVKENYDILPKILIPLERHYVENRIKNPALLEKYDVFKRLQALYSKIQEMEDWKLSAEDKNV